MTSTLATLLAPVLSPADLSFEELQAARLDGDVYDLGGAYCLIGELEGPAHRARAVLAGRSPRLIAELGTAAWVWGAADLPSRLTFAVSPDARARLSPSSGVAIRELVYEEADVVDLGAARVASPLRTVVDLARLEERSYDPDAVLRLAAVTGVRLEEAIALLAERRGLPAKRIAVGRLRRLLARQAVETR